MMALLLSPRFWAFLVAAAVLGFTHFTTYRIGKSVVRAEWNEQRLADAKRHAEELEAAITRQRTLQASIDKIRKEHRNEVDRIGRAHAALVDGLRDRPEANGNGSDVPEDSRATTDAGWCTGARLYRNHAEAFAREAARAAELQSYLRECRAAYQSARDGIASRSNTQGGAAASLLDKPHEP